MSQQGQHYAVTQPFWVGARIGQLMIPHCGACDRWQWPVRYRCVNCGGMPDWKAASGRGTLLAWSEIRRPPRPELKALGPYVIVFVQLEEGPRILTRLTRPARSCLQAGQPVRCSFEVAEMGADGAQLPVFSIYDLRTDVDKTISL